MIDYKNKAGFSLVELAISLVIIGVLIGGVLKGQELVDNSRIVTLGSQIGKYRASVSSFYDIFDEYPGDMIAPEDKIPVCAQATCTFQGSRDGDGDGLIEGISDVEGSDTSNEGRGFWEHLAAASIVIDTKIQPGTTNKFGLTHPTSPFGGGFTVMYDPELDSTTTLPGNYFRISRSLTSAGASATSSMPPLLATALDRKLDDSKAGAGKIRGYGDDCMNSSDDYDISVTSRSCDLLVRF